MIEFRTLGRVLTDLGALCLALLGVFMLLVGGTLLMAAFLGLILGVPR